MDAMTRKRRPRIYDRLCLSRSSSGACRGSNAGDDKQLYALYERFLPLIVFEQQPGVAVRKEIFRLRGLLQSNCVRHPGRGIDTQTADHLQRLLNSLLPNVDLTTPLTF